MPRAPCTPLKSRTESFNPDQDLLLYLTNMFLCDHTKLWPFHNVNHMLQRLSQMFRGYVMHLSDMPRGVTTWIPVTRIICRPLTFLHSTDMLQKCVIALTFTLHVYNLTFMPWGEGESGGVGGKKGCQDSDRTSRLRLNISKCETRGYFWGGHGEISRDACGYNTGCFLTSSRDMSGRVLQRILVLVSKTCCFPNPHQVGFVSKPNQSITFIVKT